MFRTSSKTTIGIIYAIFGILLFSAKAVLVKLAYKYKVDHLVLLSWFFLIKKNNYPTILGYFYSIEKLGTNTFSIFGSLGPVSTIILAFIFLGERISLLQVVGMLIVIGGVSMISKKKEK